MQKKTVGILGMVALFPAIYLVFGVYVGFHEAVAAEVAQAVVDAKIAKLEEKIDAAQTTATASAGKLDVVGKQLSALVVDSAISAVAALKLLRDEHLAKPDQNTSAWRIEKNRLDTAIEKATLRRNCLLEDKPNCDLLQ